MLAVTKGTYRTVPAAETWNSIKEVLATAHVTRVADITRLDDIGIPVWQAIRPDSANVAISQGKGIDSDLARISAAMEAIELKCAETPSLDAIECSLATIRSELTYDPGFLPLVRVPVGFSGVRLRWCRAIELVSGRSTWVPEDAVRVDLRIRHRWQPPLIKVSSNGLASGNTIEEAMLHGLLELLERHQLTVQAAQGDIWKQSVNVLPGGESEANNVLRKLTAAGVSVQVTDVTGNVGIPTFAARIWSSSAPRWFAGSGAHLDPDVALCRALTEAAQSRLAAIAGARDDLSAPAYSFGSSAPPYEVLGRSEQPFSACISELLSPHSGLTAELLNAAALDLGREVRVLSQRFQTEGLTALCVDITDPDIGIPVVHMLAPGALMDERAWE